MDKNTLSKTTVSYNMSKDLHPLKYQYSIMIIKLYIWQDFSSILSNDLSPLPYVLPRWTLTLH